MSDPSRPAPNPRLVLGTVATLVVCTQLGRALSPMLVTEAPLLLVALSPTPPHLVIAAAVSAYLPYILVATARRMAGSVAGYYLGVLYGEAAVQWIEGRAGVVGRVLRLTLTLFARFPYPMIFLVPIGTSWMAGMSHLPRRLYFPVATAGHVMWSSVFYYAGESLKPWIDPLLVFVGEHMMELTGATVVAVIVWQLIRRRRAKPGPAGIDLGS